MLNIDARQCRKFSFDPLYSYLVVISAENEVDILVKWLLYRDVMLNFTKQHKPSPVMNSL